MNKISNIEKIRKFYINSSAVIIFILIARAIYILYFSPDYEINGSSYIFSAKPGLVEILWSIVILCGLMIPLSIYYQYESVRKRETGMSRVFQFMIMLTIMGMLSSSIYGISFLNEIHIVVDRDSFSYSSMDSNVNVTWDFDNINAYNAPWYKSGEMTDEYAWINFCCDDYSLHVPLNYIGGADTLIEQSYLYWKAYNS